MAADHKILKAVGIKTQPFDLDLKFLKHLAEKVYFKDWAPIFRGQGDGFLFHWMFTERGETWHTRKWYVSRHACESEVIQTMLLAALQGVEHEAREAFKVDGKTLYGPHINHRSLAAVSDQLETRA